MEMMDHIPLLSELEVQDIVGEENFTSGQEYLQTCSIRGMYRDSNALYAECVEAPEITFHVKASFQNKISQNPFCSCYSLENHPCIHISAMLLYWADFPEKFEKLEKIETLLENRSKEDLLQLLSKVLNYHRSLKRLIRSLVDYGEVTKNAADESYIFQVSEIFHRVGLAWNVDTQLYKDLRTVKLLGDELRGKGDYCGALSIYDALCMGILNNYLSLFDEGGELVDLVQDCIFNMNELLENEKNDVKLRKLVLSNLFRIYHTDMQFGCIGFGEKIPEALSKFTNYDEKNTISAWIKDLLKTGKNIRRSYQEEGYRKLLSSLN
jgi:hypothetical protein